MDEEKNDEMTKKAENKEKGLFRQVFGTFGPILIIGIIVSIILTAAFMYFLDIDTANFKDKDESNVPYNFFKYSNEINVSKDGKITTKYNAQEIWDNIIENGGNVDEYLDNAAELKELMDAQLVTQFPDTRSNPDEKIDWSKFFTYSKDSDNPESQEMVLTSEVQGIVKFKRANADGTKTTMTYVDPDTYQFNIDEYNRTGSEEAKKEALSHFTIGVNRANNTGDLGQSLAGFTTEQFFAAVKDVADTVYAHRSEYVYGHSTTTPPCEKEASDGMKHISCDRLIAKALYNLGVTDQKAGGITIWDTDFLEAHGFRKIESQSEVQHGDIIVQGDGNKPVHWFVVDTCDSNGNCTKYDMGSNDRIQSKQPMTGQLDAGGNHKFMAAYRVNYASPENVVTTDSEGLGEKRDITSSTVDKDNKNLVSRMQKSLRLSSYSNLSYLIIPYYNFEGKVEKGEMVVCRELADEVLLIFQELYKIKYPIERMELVDNYDAIDWKSIKANNTSAFNYRKANDGKKEYDNLSNHAYGKCIDINPLINPYIVNYHVSLDSAYTTHELGGNPDYNDKYKYRDTMTGWTDIEKKARIAKGTEIYNIFTKYGWQWLEYAGDTNKDLDSQHFQKLDTTNVKVINRTTTQTNSSGTASTSSSANKSTSNIIFIGDSRTEGIRDTVKSDSKFICLGSQGYSWMKNTAFPQADQIVNSDSKVIIWMGVNDLGNIDNYIKEVNNKASQWTSKGAKVYYAAVGPLGWDDQYASNSGIESFNKKLKEGLAYNVTYIELYQYLKNNGYKTVDSTHYNSETNKKVYDYLVNAVYSGVTSSSNMPTESPFTKYELTDHQLTGLAAVAFSEQGTLRGAAAEASLMANRFELIMKGNCYGVTGGDGLFKYVGLPKGDPNYWFYKAWTYIDSGHLAEYSGGGPVTEEMKSVVKSVLVDGKRTLPGYVDEHDSWSGKDFNAYNDGKDITDSREAYTQFKTQIKNNYGSHYTFWGWSDPSNKGSDPFGYISEENRARIGEFYYDYESGNGIGDANIANQETTYYVKVATWNQTITNVEYTEPGKDGYTDVTYNMTSQNINYQDFLSGYILPFNYLWAHLVITEDKDFVMELADLVYNSEIEITVHDNFSETTSQNSEDYWSTIYVAKGRDSNGEIIYGPERAVFQKITTTTYRNNTIETALTRANVWIVDYKQDFEYQTTSNGSKWVAKEKDIREKTEIDTDEKNFVTILRNHGTARNAIFECDSWLFEIIEEPDNGISDMLDLTKYLIYKATGVKYDGIDTYDFGVYDPATFKKTTDGFVGNGIEEKLWWMLKDIGYSDYAAAGAMGNFSAETDDGKEIHSDRVEPGGTGIGIVQWSKGRHDAIVKYAESKGTTWKDETIQLEFLKAELTDGGCNGFAEKQRFPEYKIQYDSFINADTPEEAAVWFDGWFERSNGSRLEVRKRGARFYYDKFHGKTRPTAVEGTYSSEEVAAGSFGTYTASYGKKFILYLQGGDAPWRDNDYGDSGSMAAAGCGPAALAMIATAYNPSINPEHVRAQTVSMYGRGNHSNAEWMQTVWNKLGLNVQTSIGPKGDKQRIINCLQNGGQIWFIVYQCKYTSGSHCMALLDYNAQNDTVYVAQSNPNRKPYGWDSLDVVMSCMKDERNVLYVGGGQ